MKIDYKTLGACLALPLAVGGVSALLTWEDMRRFSALAQPPLSPPMWLFPVAWTVLYALMGLASYLVLASDAPGAQVRGALGVYGGQLAVNFFWPLLFFSLGSYLLAFLWLVLLWLLIWATLLLFARIGKRAGWLLVPYLAWVTFAGYLNFGVYLLN